MEVNDPKEAIEWVIDMVGDLPAEFRVEAFRILLENRLGSGKSAPLHVDEKRDQKREENDSTSLERWQRRLVENLPEAHAVAKRGKREQQALWAVIELMRLGDEADTVSIRKAIRNRLGVTPQNVRNTSRTLRKLMPMFIDRRERPGEKGFSYHPTIRALEIFEGLN